MKKTFVGANAEENKSNVTPKRMMQQTKCEQKIGRGMVKEEKSEA
jgi:hypothetical protein